MKNRLPFDDVLIKNIPCLYPNNVNQHDFTLIAKTAPYNEFYDCKFSSLLNEYRSIISNK